MTFIVVQDTERCIYFGRNLCVQFEQVGFEVLNVDITKVLGFAYLEFGSVILTGEVGFRSRWLRAMLKGKTKNTQLQELNQIWSYFSYITRSPELKTQISVVVQRLHQSFMLIFMFLLYHL